MDKLLGGSTISIDDLRFHLWQHNFWEFLEAGSSGVIKHAEKHS